MASRRRPVPAEAAAPARLLRTERWSGLRRGDLVEIAGIRVRGARWTFVAHVRNTVTGEEWVEVVGGRPPDRQVRSFRPEQVYPPRRGARDAGRPSLADAPRLPLG